MGFPLPAGVINTESAYFYADGSNALGPLVMQPSDAVLVLVDYSGLVPPVTINAHAFTVDIASNPPLILAYDTVNAAQNILTFLLTGGVPGQQYNISINLNVGARTDVLTVNIPSNGDNCGCDSGSQFPGANQLPSANPYVNDAPRFTYGPNPPVAPSLLDQWWNTTTQQLMEWITTDGNIFYWSLLVPNNWVPEAPEDSQLYGRINGAWSREPVQTDAPDGQLYCRVNGAWVLNTFQGEQGPPGPQGATGQQGPPGPAGPQGAQGSTGPEGPASTVPGPEGPQGPPGQSITITGSVPTSADLPASANAGEGYITEDTGHLWVWDGTQWTDCGNVTGPPGATGPAGPQGPIGPTGVQGVPGAVGAQGPSGPAGPAGADSTVPGPPGPAGPEGPEGPVGPQGLPGPQGPPNNTMPAGVTDGSDAVAGQVGEYLEAIGGSMHIDAQQVTSLVSLTVPPGDWDIWGNGSFTNNNGISRVHLSVATSAGQLQAPLVSLQYSTPILYDVSLTSTPTRRTMRNATTFYMTGQAFFPAAGSTVAAGAIRARRRR